MSVAERPFSDPRNTYVVPNDDPKAFDTSYRGQPGTHNEQRCCGDNAPYMSPAYYSPVTGTVPAQLTCHACETYLEQQWSQNFIPTFAAMAPFVRTMAMVASYVPVFGTAVSFVLNSTLALAQGNAVGPGILDSLGDCVPGQPVSGIGFKAARAIASGASLAESVVGSLPLDNSIKDVIRSAGMIFYHIASGEKVTDALLDEARTYMPDAGKKAMDIARQLASGQSVANVVASEAMKTAGALAHSQGPAAVNDFIAQSGYQAALQTLGTDLSQALSLGLMSGTVEKHQFIGTFGTAAEKNVATNTTYEAQGRAMVYGASPAKYKFASLANMLSKPTFPITVEYMATNPSDLRSDAPLVKRQEVRNDPITPAWLRGFFIAMAVCAGSSQETPPQVAVYQTMAEEGGRRGFQAGQAVQFSRFTLGGIVSTMVSESASPALSWRSALLASLPKTTPTKSLGLPKVASAPTLGLPSFVTQAVAPPRTTPVVVDQTVYAQKLLDRSRWVDYYQKLA